MVLLRSRGNQHDDRCILRARQVKARFDSMDKHRNGRSLRRDVQERLNGWMIRLPVNWIDVTMRILIASVFPVWKSFRIDIYTFISMYSFAWSWFVQIFVFDRSISKNECSRGDRGYIQRWRMFASVRTNKKENRCEFHSRRRRHRLDDVAARSSCNRCRQDEQLNDEMSHARSQWKQSWLPMLGIIADVFIRCGETVILVCINQQEEISYLQTLMDWSLSLHTHKPFVLALQSIISLSRLRSTRGNSLEIFEFLSQRPNPIQRIQQKLHARDRWPRLVKLNQGICLKFISSASTLCRKRTPLVNSTANVSARRTMLVI